MGWILGRRSNLWTDTFIALVMEPDMRSKSLQAVTRLNGSINLERFE